MKNQIVVICASAGQREDIKRASMFPDAKYLLFGNSTMGLRATKIICFVPHRAPLEFIKTYIETLPTRLHPDHLGELYVIQE